VATTVKRESSSRTPTSFLRRKWRGLRWRLVHDTHYLIFSAPPLPLPPPSPPSVQLLRLSATEDPAWELARTAMHAAEEPDVVRERLRSGETFFGWRSGEAVVSFGWATLGQRAIGLRPCREGPGRGFLYNFATLSDWRGRGLYPALLQQIRYTLGQDGITELLVDVKTVNLTSLRGIVKAGFLPIAGAAYRTILQRWQVDLGHVELPGLERAVW
jgi:GNAT superfamily N-acetyltransferase